MVGDPTGGVGTGIGRAIGDAAIKKAAELANKFRNRDYAFLPDTSLAREVKEQRNGREFSIYKPYLTATNRRVPVQVGLALRKHAKDQDYVERNRAFVRKKFGIQGLHLAQAAQAGILSNIMAELAKTGSDPATYAGDVQRVFDNIDDYVFFIERTADPKTEPAVVLARVKSKYPPVFVVAASGHAQDQASRIAKKVSEQLSEYEVTGTRPETTYLFAARD